MKPFIFALFLLNTTAIHLESFYLNANCSDSPVFNYNEHSRDSNCFPTICSNDPIRPGIFKTTTCPFAFPLLGLLKIRFTTIACQANAVVSQTSFPFNVCVPFSLTQGLYFDNFTLTIFSNGNCQGNAETNQTILLETCVNGEVWKVSLDNVTTTTTTTTTTMPSAASLLSIALDLVFLGVVVAAFLLQN